MKDLWIKIWPFIKNKYLLTLTFFFVWIIFFSQYNLIERTRLVKNLKELEAEKEYYKQQIVKDSTRLLELTTKDPGNNNLEKFAREMYYMKKPNEDIFVILEKEEK